MTPLLSVLWAFFQCTLVSESSSVSAGAVVKECRLVPASPPLPTPRPAAGRIQWLRVRSRFKSLRRTGGTGGLQFSDLSALVTATVIFLPILHRHMLRGRAQPLARKKGAVVKIPLPWRGATLFTCSFENMEAMISTLLVISALVISLIVAMMLGIQSSDLEGGDLLWIDYLNMTLKPWLLTIDSGGIWHTTVNPSTWDTSNGGFVSHIIGYKCAKTVGLLTVAIFVLTGAYFSLHTSLARNDAKCFEGWMVVGCVLVGGSFALFFAAFFQGTAAIGNAMGILYPAIRWHNSYEDLLEEVETGNHSGVMYFALEPIVNGILNSCGIAGLSIGLVGGFAANLSASLIGSSNCCGGDKDVKILSFLKDGLNFESSEVELYLQTFLDEKLDIEQIQHLSVEQLAWIGIPYGDALKINGKAQKSKDRVHGGVTGVPGTVPAPDQIQEDLIQLDQCIQPCPTFVQGLNLRNGSPKSVESQHSNDT